MQLFDLSVADPATFKKNMTAFHTATTEMKAGHPIGIINPSQLESTNKFGKNCHSIIAIGHFSDPVKVQAVKRLARAVPLVEGDLVFSSPRPGTQRTTSCPTSRRRFSPR